MTRSKVWALIIGAILTPVATGLSLQFLPVLAPLMIYGLIAAAFAYQNPPIGWKWGLWLSAGMLMAIVIVLLFGGGYLIWTEPDIKVMNVLEGARITLIFGLIPAATGGCIGGLAAIYLSNKSVET